MKNGKITISIRKPKSRIHWGFDPVTRTIPSRRRYRRSQAKAQKRRDIADAL